MTPLKIDRMSRGKWPHVRYAGSTKDLERYLNTRPLPHVRIANEPAWGHCADPAIDAVYQSFIRPVPKHKRTRTRHWHSNGKSRQTMMPYCRKNYCHECHKYVNQAHEHD